MSTDFMELSLGIIEYKNERVNSTGSINTIGYKKPRAKLQESKKLIGSICYNEGPGKKSLSEGIPLTIIKKAAEAALLFFGIENQI